MRINPLQNTNNGIEKATKPHIKERLTKDTVSFGHGFDYSEADQNLQIYRSISEGEYKKLISGETVHCGGYATSDERGWQANNWKNGFVNAGHKNEPVYFVTFKIGSLPISDWRDSDRDTRYGFGYTYSLENVANVRKGSNAHGEIVYAENPEIKQKDIEQKQEKITQIKDSLVSETNERTRDNLWDELSSYAKEFPQLAQEMISYVSFSSEADVNGLADIINIVDNKDDMGLYRKCARAYLDNNLRPSIYSLGYFIRYGERQDIPLLFDMLSADKFPGEPAAAMLKNCAKDEDFAMIRTNLLVNNPAKLQTLATFCSSKNGEEYTQAIRDILTLIKDPKTRKGEAYLYSGLIVCCAEELGKKGNKSDIELLQNFFNPQTPNFYPDSEVKDAIRELKAK